MKTTIPAIDILTDVLIETVTKVLTENTRMDVAHSPTVQSIPKVSIRPEIGCFVQFSGDYQGLVVINFSGGAAIGLYRNYMMTMGLSAEELPSHHSASEVSDGIGELTNQIMGNSMKCIESRYQLGAYCGQPKALALNSAITLIIDSDYRDNRRLTFQVDGHKFYVEFAMEGSAFIVSHPHS